MWQNEKYSEKSNSSNSQGYTGGTSSTAFKATWYPGLFPPLPFLREKCWAWGCFTRGVLQEFTFCDKGSNQHCSFSQKRKNTLNHRYLETNSKPLVLVRKLHKHRRSKLKFFFWNTNPSAITTSSPAMWLQKLWHHNKHPNYFNRKWLFNT